jgi:serine/threonine-protein kinase RsbW
MRKSMKHKNSPAAGTPAADKPTEATAHEQQPAAWQCIIDLPSERGISRLVTEPLLEHLGAHGWPPADIFSIHLAAEEAIVNAIVHGNKLDPNKKVHVECLISAEVARVEITDEGAGFDPKAVPDCTSEERWEVPSGRGVMLMRTFMTRLEYNAKGNSVLMEKRRD